MTNLCPMPSSASVSQPPEGSSRAGAPAGTMGAPSPVPLQVDRLVKQYGRQRAVDGLSLTVRAGQIVGFLGPNGSGKTTTMRCVLGLARPSGGAIKVFGRVPGSPVALASVGAVIEEPALYTALSGRGHLRLAARWAGVEAARADEVLSLVGLSEVGRKPCGKYSLGMKMRLGLATALLKDPPLLVLDEPGNGLDPAGLRDVRELLAALRAEGRAVLLSSHLLGEVEELADHLVIVRHGRSVYEGPVQGVLEVTGETRLTDAFLALTEAASGPGPAPGLRRSGGGKPNERTGAVPVQGSAIEGCPK